MNIVVDINGTHDARNTASTSGNKCKACDLSESYSSWLACVWLTIINIGLFLLIVLLPLSFVYVEWNEIAFVRDKFGTVDTSHVVEQGRHYLPLTHELVKFPSTFQKVSFLTSDNTALSIFTQDGYQISIEIQFYYRLIPSNLKTVYDLYSMNYGIGVINLAKLTIRELSGSSSSGVYLPLQSYIDNRTHIANVYAHELERRTREQLSIDVPAKYFRIIKLGIPDDMIQRYQQTVIQLQNNEVSANTQQVLALEAQTEKMVSVINAQTNYTLTSAAIESDLIVKNAIIESNNIINNADIDGFNILCNLLNIVNPADIIEFAKILNMQNNPATKLFYNIQNNIIIS